MTLNSIWDNIFAPKEPHSLPHQNKCIETLEIESMDRIEKCQKVNSSM